MNALRFCLLITAFNCVLALGGEPDFLAFEGLCKNAGSGAQGHIKLFLSSQDTVLAGCMSVTGWVGGSGSVTGTRNGTHVHFTTVDPRWGITVEWQGKIENGVVAGEYSVKSTSLMEQQVGEWSASLKGWQTGAKSDENVTKVLFKMYLEDTLNAPVKTTKGELISGAESLFRATHPAGTGFSITVEDLEIDWNSESKTRVLSDIYKFRATYVLYWKGVITPTGWTRFQMAYNTKIRAFTSNEMLQSTGTTKKEVNEAAFGLGVILGKFAVDSLLNSK